MFIKRERYLAKIRSFSFSVCRNPWPCLAAGVSCLTVKVNTQGMSPFFRWATAWEITA